MLGDARADEVDCDQAHQNIGYAGRMSRSRALAPNHDPIYFTLPSCPVRRRITPPSRMPSSI